ncbi:hypothetical protein, partial [Aeromonas hydrophila]|uniref:hypothetical protein n=1 Tax=Aeromonas hydrophila TaxID=644 RepID=UPI004039C527
GFLHREGTGDIGLDYLNVILVIQLGQQRHEYTNLFMALLAELDYENYIQVVQADIASALSMQKTNVSRAIK